MTASDLARSSGPGCQEGINILVCSLTKAGAARNLNCAEIGSVGLFIYKENRAMQRRSI